MDLLSLWNLCDIFLNTLLNVYQMFHESRQFLISLQEYSCYYKQHNIWKTFQLCFKVSYTFFYIHSIGFISSYLPLFLNWRPPNSFTINGKIICFLKYLCLIFSTIKIDVLSTNYIYFKYNYAQYVTTTKRSILEEIQQMVAKSWDPHVLMKHFLQCLSFITFVKLIKC